MPSDLRPVFARLKAILAPHAVRLVQRTDTATAYYLDTHEVRAKDGYRTTFGGVEVKARYVSFHLMPVYVHPDMLDGVSAALRKRMQGRSCFNFRSVDDTLFVELDGLVRAGIDRFAADGRI